MSALVEFLLSEPTTETNDATNVTSSSFDNYNDNDEGSNYAADTFHIDQGGYSGHQIISSSSSPDTNLTTTSSTDVVADDTQHAGITATITSSSSSGSDSINMLMLMTVTLTVIWNCISCGMIVRSILAARLNNNNSSNNNNRCHRFLLFGMLIPNWLVGVTVPIYVAFVYGGENSVLGAIAYGCIPIILPNLVWSIYYDRELNRRRQFELHIQEALRLQRQHDNATKFGKNPTVYSINEIEEQLLITRHVVGKSSSSKATGMLRSLSTGSLKGLLSPSLSTGSLKGLLSPSSSSTTDSSLKKGKDDLVLDDDAVVAPKQQQQQQRLASNIVNNDDNNEEDGGSDDTVTVMTESEVSSVVEEQDNTTSSEVDIESQLPQQQQQQPIHSSNSCEKESPQEDEGPSNIDNCPVQEQDDVVDIESPQVMEQQHVPPSEAVDESSDDYVVVAAAATDDDYDVVYEDDDDQRTVPTCPICLESYQIGDVIAYSRNPTCQHVYHKCCVIEWIQSSSHNSLQDEECPMCRTKFVSCLLSQQNKVAP